MSFTIIFVSVVVLNILWYRLKYILKNNGYEVSIWNHFSDISNALDLALTNTASRKIRKEAFILFSVLIIGSIVFVCTFFFGIVESPDEWRCKSYNEYLAHQTNGRVIDKFIDKENHSFKTLIIKNNNTEDAETEIPLWINDFYEKTEIGDTVIKQNNSAYVLIKNMHKSIVLADTNSPCKDK